MGILSIIKEQFQNFNPEKEYLCGVENGSSGDYIYATEWTQLMIAVLSYSEKKEKTLEEIKTILKKDPEQLDKVNSKGYNAIMLACMYSNTLSHNKVVELLLKYGPEFYTYTYGNMLLDFISEPSITLKNTLTLAIQCYPKYCSLDCIKILLKHADEIEAKYSKEEEEDYLEEHETLKSVFFKETSTYYLKQTPIFYALYEDHFDIVKLLIKHSDREYMDSSLRTVYDCTKDKEMIKLLRKNGFKESKDIEIY